MSHTIRQYRDSDLNGVLSAWESASKIAHPFLTPEFMDSERHNIPNMYLPNADTWVADLDGAIIGFIALIGDEVGAIFVDPVHQGAGVGRSLMDKACDLCGDLELGVFEANSIGRGFYEHYGFKFVNEVFHEASGHNIFNLKFANPKKG
ncbi:MAG: putative acetyltransferase [Alphaproteobacteria bacterium]